MIDKLTENHRSLIGQIARFGITGGFLTIVTAGGYWVIATFGGIDPNVSMAITFVIASGFGYLLHSRWSFKGHGSRENATARTIKFAITNSTGFLANQFFVWLLVKHMGGPTWWPVLPVVFITPIVTFSLKRRWVFG